jgi:hypothetical protein
MEIRGAAGLRVPSGGTTSKLNVMRKIESTCDVIETKLGAYTTQPTLTVTVSPEDPKYKEFSKWVIENLTEEEN